MVRAGGRVSLIAKEPPMIDPAKQKQLHAFLRQHRYGAIATVSRDGAPEAALIGIAAMPDLSLIFETIGTTRKCVNLRRDGRVALVVGCDGDTTLQYEGLADERPADDVAGDYYAVLPENLGHRGWPGLTYVRVRPRWMRLSTYGAAWSVEEFHFDR